MLPNHHITKPVLHRRDAGPTASSTWCGRPTGLVPGDAWSDYLPKAPRTWSPTGSTLKCGNYNTKTRQVRRQGLTNDAVDRRYADRRRRLRRLRLRCRCRDIALSMRMICDRLRRASCCCLAFASHRHRRRRARTFDAALRQIRRPIGFGETEAAIAAVAATRQSARRGRARGACRTARLHVRSGEQERIRQVRSPAASSRRRDRRRPRRSAAGRSQDRSRQQPAAPRDRGRARRPDAAVARSGASGSRRRRRCSSRATPPRCRRSTTAIGQGNRHARQARAAARRAPPSSCYKPTRPRADKLDAVAVIRARGDQDALGAARRLAGRRAGRGRGARRSDARSPRSRASSRSGTAVQNVWYGLSLGSVLLLAAIGLAITFGVMGVINMAHGEMVMLGAYTTFVVQEVIRTTCAGPVRLFAADRPAAGLPRRRRSSASPSSAASSASSTAGRWRRCSPPGACR